MSQSERRHAIVDLDRATIAAMIGWPSALDALVIEPQRSGFTNTSYRVRTGRDDLLLRLFVNDPSACQKEERLRSRLAGVPVPELLVAEPDPTRFGHAYIIQRWVEGVPLRAALDRDVSLVAADVGHALARIAAVRFDSEGTLEPSLVVRPRPWLAAFERFVADACTSSRVRARIGGDLCDAVYERVVATLPRLAAAGDARHLMHGDLTIDNLIVAGEPPYLANLAAVIDWECANIGSRFADIGNLFREPELLPPEFADAFARGYRQGGGDLPDDWRALAACCDAWDLLAFVTIDAERATWFEESRVRLERFVASATV